MISNNHFLIVLVFIIVLASTKRYKNSKFNHYISKHSGILLITSGIVIGIYTILTMPPYSTLIIPIGFILIGITDIIKIRKKP